MDISTFQIQLNDAVLAENGNRLATLLHPASQHGKELVRIYRNHTVATLNRSKNGLPQPWGEISIQFVLVCSNVAKRKCEDAYNEHKELVSLFFRFFTNNNGWTLPALFSILRDLRDLAHDADLQAKVNNRPMDTTEDAARTISKAFGFCMTDRTSPPELSRKWGVYYIVGLIMKCYFRVKRIALSKNILRALNANDDLPAFHLYPTGHRVTYQYYLGMLSFLNEDYVKAEQQLTIAFYNCDIKMKKNLERILTYLIPLRILLGQLPSQSLLNDFSNLQDLYLPFTSAIKKGDIAAFDRALETKEKRLLDLNLWLTIEKARELCLRGLFRKTWITFEKSTRMPISMFHAALKLSSGKAGADITEEEAECLVANMIYKGFMKGYISHEKQIVVLSGVSAFPKLSERPTPFGLL